MKGQRPLLGGLIGVALLLSACSASINGVDDAPAAAQVDPTAPPPTAVPTIPPTETRIPPTETAVPPTTAPTATELPPTPQPTPAATVARTPLWAIGSTADWTATNDPVGIEGRVEVISADQIVVRGFVSFVSEAPGVDIRLGVGGDFSDAVAVSLKDITGDEYDGRTLTLTLPDAAFDSRTFDSIGVFCFDTGDLFDYALFEPPPS